MAASASPEPILPFVLLGLTAVAGLVDAVSYLALGHVFTANMTGNVVFLGFAAARAPGLSLTRSGTALAAFLVGAVFGGRMAAEMSGGPRHRWTGAAFGAEAGVFLVAMAVAVGGGGLSMGPPRLYAVIVLTAFAMGIRNATVRKLAVPDLTTTVLTLTVTALAADSALAGGSNPRWARRAAAVVTMCAGAAFGVWILPHSVALALGLCAAASSVCALVAYLGMRRTQETAAAEKEPSGEPGEG
jgi:uncharacterized membrane protein YoaK (UPF0700 family)